MTVIRISETERAAIIATRPRYGGERNTSEKKANVAVYTAIKRKYGIPSNCKLKVEIDSSSNPDYLVLKDKETGEALTQLGHYAPASTRTPAPKAVPQTLDADYGNVKQAPEKARQTDVTGAEFKVASINLEDAVQLLRAEGDMCDSYATTTALMNGNVKVEGGRLYFVL